ncbi:MAG TPA: hypothetical protein PKE40_01015 [Arachnia sp.]|nr:hypothetical protein [Arachnia sp.]HMT84907.1 hypothetical protein [Arachnia sp.]
MADHTPDALAVPDRRTLLTAAAWSVPVLAAPMAVPLAAATVTNSAGDFVVSAEFRPRNPNRPTWEPEFFLTPSPDGTPIPAGTMLVIELNQVHSRSWTTVSSLFTYVSTDSRNADGSPTTDSVNARYTTSIYLTATAFTEQHSLHVTCVPWPGAVWGFRVTATLPAGWSAGPNAVLSATLNPPTP